MSDVYWEIDGRRVTEAEVEDAMTAEIFAQVSEQVQTELADMTCSEHGRKPEITISYDEGLINFRIKCCCEPFDDAVGKKLEKFLGEKEST